MTIMTPSNFVTALLLAAAVWKGADLYYQAAPGAATQRADMHVDPDTTPSRPAIDLAAPSDFQTATFALG